MRTQSPCETGRPSDRKYSRDCPGFTLELSGFARKQHRSYSLRDYPSRPGPSLPCTLWSLSTSFCTQAALAALSPSGPSLSLHPCQLLLKR